ncbi:MAG: TIGR03435 family protein [Candidatus Aminicenantes bacterium]|nr:MAG: TIGR03435 family protein [Candidatus Aminicenantes bacterium]
MGMLTMRCNNTLLPATFMLLLLPLIVSSAFAQKPKVGEPAPEIALEKVVSPPSVSVPTLASLRGKVVVLEFWGVWCGHCVENIPHLNELADKFGPRGVEFLSISDDREKVVREFLEKTKINGTVAVDADSSAIKRYGVIGFPRMFIIGRDGKILAETHPALINDDTMEDALAGRPLRLKEEKAEVSAKPTPKPLFEVWVRPSASDKVVGGYGPYGVYAEALPPKVCLAWAFGVPESRVVLETTLPDEKYDIKAEGSPQDKNTLPALQLALSSALGVTVTREEREVEAYVLAQLPGQSHKLQIPGPESTNGGRSQDNVSGTNLDLKNLLLFLDSSTGIPVVDETGLKEKYTYDLKAVEKDYESLRKAVREQLGLDLRKERRTLSVMVVRKA